MLDVTIRLFVLCVYALTCVMCFVRVAFTRESRALTGNIAFGLTALLFWIYQAVSLSLPATTFTYLAMVPSLACLVYLLTLARKGPE